jgi:hypothetical protein
MVHEQTLDVVFGGEMDGRTLSTSLTHGKPVQGEIYIVSATESQQTLVAATESAAQSQLQSATAVNPSTAGSLTAASASSLEASFGSFFQMWSRSATVSMADSYGQVAEFCPSSNTSAYVALGAGTALYSSSQPSAVQRFQTTSKLKLLLVVTMIDGCYSEFIDKCSTATFIMAGLCACVMVSLFLLPVFKPRECPGAQFNILVTIVIVLVMLIGLMWIGQTSTWHRDAADDLMHQLVWSMDTLLLASLQASIKMVKEAHNTWSFTGAPASSLFRMNSWSTELLEDYHDSTALSMLRYGTASGLEQSVNSTSNGVRVLSRNFYGSPENACLRAYYKDGVTTDGTADVCHYDPRFTTWYETGLGSKKDGAGYPQVVSNFYSIGDSGKLGMGVVTRCERGDFVGTWAAEFTLDSVGGFLQQLKNGLHGTLFIASADETGVQDGLLIAASNASMEHITQCSYSGDPFVSSAAVALYEINNNTFFNLSNRQVLRGHNLVTKDTANITSGLLNVASISRGQLYYRIEHLFNWIFSGAAIALTVLLAMNYRQARRRQSAVAELLPFAEEDEEETQAEEELLVALVEEQVMSLETLLRKKFINKSPNSSPQEVVTAVSEGMRSLAARFLRNTKKGLNLTTQIDLMLLEMSWIFVRFNLSAKSVWITYKKGPFMFQS